MATISNLKKAEEIFKALGSRSRIMIMRQLENNAEMPIKDIAKKIGMKPQSASEHLRLMQRAGILEERKHGFFVKYKISPKMISLIQEMKIKDLIYG